MSFKVKIDKFCTIPIYKQLVQQFENAIRSGMLQEGDLLPSMNEYACELEVSKETIKKAYGILRVKELLVPIQGKGFYVAALNDRYQHKNNILLLFDKLTIYNNAIYNSLMEELGDSYDVTLLTHNQNLELLEHYLDIYLDKFDYYIICPHFPLDEDSQSTTIKQLSRIPKRKLIMVDHWVKGVSGSYSVVYQDYENDIYNCLKNELERLKNVSAIKTVILQSSLYGQIVSKGIVRFCQDFGLHSEVHDSIPKNISPNDAVLILTSQLDSDMTELLRSIKASNLQVGKDIFIISYNDFDLCDIIFNGLTTVSTDFRKMGQLVSTIILNKKILKIHCDFNMKSRATF